MNPLNPYKKQINLEELPSQLSNQFEAVKQIAFDNDGRKCKLALSYKISNKLETEIKIIVRMTKTAEQKKTKESFAKIKFLDNKKCEDVTSKLKDFFLKKKENAIDFTHPFDSVYIKQSSIREYIIKSTKK